MFCDIFVVKVVDVNEVLHPSNGSVTLNIVNFCLKRRRLLEFHLVYVEELDGLVIVVASYDVVFVSGSSDVKSFLHAQLDGPNSFELLVVIEPELAELVLLLFVSDEVVDCELWLYETVALHILMQRLHNFSLLSI